MNEARLRNMSENKKKCDRIMEDKYGKKDYILNQSINKARLYFKSRVSMLPFAGNYPNYLKYQKSNWLCQCTLSKEEESHLLSGQCPVYGDLCEGRDLTKDEDLVGLFTEILGRRERLEDNS